MLSLKSATESETLLSKLERQPELSLPSSRVDVLTCVKRRRRFLPDSGRSCSSFKVLDAKAPVTVSRESNDALSQCSDLTLMEDSVFLVHGDLVLSDLIAVLGLHIRSLCRNEESLLGVSHQLTAVGPCVPLESLREKPTGSLVLSLGVTDSLRFSLGVSLNSTGDKDVQESTLLMLCGLWNKPEYPLSEHSS